MSESSNKADVSGNAGRGCPKRTFIDLICEVLQKGQVRSTRYRRACMIRCMNVDEATRVCADRSRWRSVVSAYNHLKGHEFMYIYKKTKKVHIYLPTLHFGILLN